MDAPWWRCVADNSKTVLFRSSRVNLLGHPNHSTLIIFPLACLLSVIFVAERQFLARIEKHFSPTATRFAFADLSQD